MLETHIRFRNEAHPSWAETESFSSRFTTYKLSERISQSHVQIYRLLQKSPIKIRLFFKRDVATWGYKATGVLFAVTARSNGVLWQ